MNVRRAATFVVAIVPFHQVPVDFGPIAKTGQFARTPGALQRARKHFGKTQSAQPFRESARIAFAAFRERQIRKTCVLTRDSPSGFSMPG